MDATVQAYVAELRDQISILSDRAAQLAAALKKEQSDHEMAKGRILALEKSAAADTDTNTE